MSKKFTNTPTPKTSFFNKKIPVTWFITISAVAVAALSFGASEAFTKSHKPAAQTTDTKVSADNNNYNTPSPGASAYTFTNPVINCEGPLREVKPFKVDVQNFVGQIIKEGRAEKVAVFFRSLNNGYSFGINTDQVFRPASLMKVHNMITWLKLAEDSPSVLGRKIYFPKAQSIGVPNQVPNPMTEGQYYTINDLIKRMIVNSDNDAAYLLTKYVDHTALTKEYQAFDVKMPEENLRPDYDYLSLGEYVRLFRILYNASYLNREMSDYALNIMSQVYFREGIVSGITADVPVSHKYGEWFYNGDYQLHDCGIVYLQGNPYVIGVMTKGKDLHVLASVLKDISAFIYRHVNINMAS